MTAEVHQLGGQAAADALAQVPAPHPPTHGTRYSVDLCNKLRAVGNVLREAAAAGIEMPGMAALGMSNLAFTATIVAAQEGRSPEVAESLLRIMGHVQ